MLPYSKFHESCIRELCRRRKIPDKDLSVCIQKCQEWDFHHPDWAARVLSQRSSNPDHLELLIYALTQNFVDATTALTWPVEDLREYVKLSELFPGISPYPPILPISLQAWNSSMLSILERAGIPEAELNQWSPNQVQEVFSTGYLPPSLARKIARRKALLGIQKYPARIVQEFEKALIRITGSLELFFNSETISPWETCLWKIPEASTQQLSRITSVVFPKCFPRGFEELPILWQCRLYILSQIPFWFDPTGQTLNFNETPWSFPIPTPRANPWKRSSSS